MPSDQDNTPSLQSLRKQALLGGGAKAIEKQLAKGKKTARERLLNFFDPDTFVELDRFVTHRATEFGMDKKKFLGDGVVTGHGRVDGRLVYCFAQDFTVFGGSLSETHAAKICKVMDLAVQNGAPFIGLNDSGGARIQEGVVSLGGYADIFFRNTNASGVIPQISVIMGPCAGGAVYSPAITDFIIMTQKTSHMFITGPKVIKSVLNEDVTFEGLGGADAHSQKSGVAHFACDDEDDSIETLKKLLAYIPQNNLEEPPRVMPEDDPNRMATELDTLIPENPNQPYDMKELISHVVDDGELMEVHQGWAQNMIVGFVRLNGHSVGVVANQPNMLAGTLDSFASIKAARFVRFCDSFNIPLLTFVDVPGFLPGMEQEHGGIIRNGAKLIYAFSEATVPKLTVVTRKAYGGAYCVMCSKHIGADLNLAWPTAEIAVMGPAGAVGIIFRRDLAKADDPAVREQELEAEYRNNFANPYVAAARGYIDDVIEPRETRPRLIRALETLAGKRETRPPKKHGNIPL